MSSARPHGLSLASKVLAFFETNPGEELDADAISTKFGCSRTGVHTNLGPAVANGWLVRHEDLKSGDILYSRGPASEQPSAGDSAPKPAMRKREALALDLAGIRIDKGIPIPPPLTKSLDWTVLLDRLVDVGDSAMLPVRVRSALSKAITKAHAGGGRKFAVRVDGETLRVWREA